MYFILFVILSFWLGLSSAFGMHTFFRYIIRYHSFYAAHKEGAYDYFMNDYDRAMMPLLKLFSTYDLYSKNPETIDVAPLLSYYQELIAAFFPEELCW